MLSKSEISKTTGESYFPFVLRRLSLIVVLAIVLTGCSSDDITCWPFCSKSSSGVTDTADTTTTDTTDTTTPVVASITVTYPNGGEVLGNGTYRIKWTKTSSVGLVRIDIYNDQSTLERWLGDKLTETSIDWEVQEKNSLYRIKVTSVSDSTVYDYGGYFQINTSPQDDQY
jgi:hypothetical protein